MKKFNSVILLILLIPLALNCIWFFSGNLMAAGESGMAFHNTEWHFQITNQAVKPTALGNINNITVASAPTYWFLTQLHNSGIPEFIIQALFFWFILTSSGLAIYFLNKTLFPQLPDKYIFLAVLFYWFSPISLVNVWSRFLYNFMSFYALLPIALYFFIKGIKEKKYIYTLMFAIATAIYSYALSSTPFNIILWALLLYTWIFYILTDKPSEVSFKIKYLALSGILFALTNIWWLSQFISFVSSAAGAVLIESYFKSDDNLSTLVSLSERLGLLNNIFRFMHITYYYEKSIWLQIFEFFPMVAIEFFFSGVMFWVIYKYRQIRAVLYFGGLFLIGLFLMKGNNPPFGEIFQTVFTKVVLLQVFRNPFEKFSFIVLLAGSGLFGLSIYYLTKSFSKYTKQIYVLTLTWLIVIWGSSFWTGALFKRDDHSKNQTVSYEFKVPQYYQEANSWLKENSADNRFIQFPISGEGISYDWELPYSGVELSPALFEIPNISFKTSIPYYDRVVGKIEELFLKNKDFYKIAALLNTKYIISRSDIEWRERSLKDPQIIDNRFNEIKYPKVATFNNLNVYQIEGTTSALIYPGKNSILVTPEVNIEDFLIGGGEVGDVTYSLNKDQPPLENNTILVKPLKIMDFGIYGGSDNVMDNLLHIEHLPGSKLYPLILVKEGLERNQITSSEDVFTFDLMHLGKRVVEIYKLAEKKPEPEIINNYLQSYLSSLEKLMSSHKNYFVLEEYDGLNKLTKVELLKHKILLNMTIKLLNREDQERFNLGLNKLNQILIEQGFETIYPVLTEIKQEKGAIIVIRYKIPENGSYRLVMEGKDWVNYYEAISDIFKVQIDGEVKLLKPALGNDKIDLGEIYFNQGLHEVVFAEPSSKNLIVVPESVILDSTKNPEILFNLNAFDPYGSYGISFDAWVRKGAYFNLFAKFDNDIKRNGDFVSGYSKQIISDDYYRDFTTETMMLTPRRGGTTMSMGFIVSALNICPEARFPFSKSCKNDLQYRKQFEKETEVVLKKIAVKKMFNNQLYLIKNNNSNNSTVPTIAYKKITPSEYNVSVKNSSQPFVLVFSNLFNTNWKISYDDGSIVSEDKHFFANGYANAWLIDKTGDFNLRIKFMPQDLLDLGKIISISTFILSVMLVLIIWIKKKF